jgi:hypothetical protein
MLTRTVQEIDAITRRSGKLDPTVKFHEFCLIHGLLLFLPFTMVIVFVENAETIVCAFFLAFSLRFR